MVSGALQSSIKKLVYFTEMIWDDLIEKLEFFAHTRQFGNCKERVDSTVYVTKATERMNELITRRFIATEKMNE